LVCSMARGAMPPVDFLAVCFVRAIFGKSVNDRLFMHLTKRQAELSLKMETPKFIRGVDRRLLVTVTGFTGPRASLYGGSRGPRGEV
jgi:hypothetical protein